MKCYTLLWSTIMALIFPHYAVGDYAKLVKVEGKYDSIFLLINNKLRLIPNNYTAEFMGFKLDEVEIITNGNMKVDEPVESMVRENSSPDEAIRVYVAKFKTFQDNSDLIQESVFIERSSNPALVSWKGMYFSTSRAVRDEVIRFAWFDKKFQLKIDTSYHGVGPSYTFLNISKGADARMLVLGDNRLLVIYGHTNAYKLVRERLVEMSVHADTDVLTPNSQHRLAPVQIQNAGITMIQKNWAPFIYNGTVCFLETVNPLRAVASHTTVDTEPDPTFMPLDAGDHQLEAKFLSEVGLANIDWDYGTLRGGTPAKLIGDEEYLMFFHSRRILPWNNLFTYFMGALTFSARPPFVIKTISRVPMYHSRFYDGAWGAIDHFDYVLFPMHFFLASSTDAGSGGMAGGALANVTEDSITGPCGPECLASHDVILSCGHQDRDGWVHRINLAALYKTMVPVPAPS